MIKLKILTCIIFINFSIGCNERQSKENNFEVAKNAIEGFKGISFNIFKNWNISTRDNSIFVFDFIEAKNYFGFLIKKDNNEFLIKDKSPLGNKFFKIADYSEIEANKLGLSKDKIYDVVKAFNKTNCSDIFYIESFDGVLIKKDNIEIMYLLSKKKIEEVPKDYIKIDENWYFLK